MKTNPDKNTSDIEGYISELLDNSEISRQIAHHRLLPGSPANYGDCKNPWPKAIHKILEESGIRLYSHQARAMDLIRSGKSVMISTHTASGKSLIYNLPFYESYLMNPDTRALYLFPLKALAQDQLQAFNRIASFWPLAAGPSAALYDGDTPQAERAKIRKNPPSVLMTNPEMLHLSLLAYHESWAGFLSNLAYIVVDEAHIYRGLFGCHAAQLFRRLNRLCQNYGVDPVYIFCTATLGNPLELALNLSGKEDIKLVDESGAPKAPRHFFFVDPELSSSTCAIDMLKRALARDLRTIVYCQSRRMTELISLWASSDSGDYRDSVSAYRAGFLPEERREIEARMSGGDLKAVVSTSALELGIDIGGLDLCILAGYPGTIMQTLQRGGRVGRSGRESAVMVIAGEDALDQYFIRNPQEFFTRPLEKAVINPFNAVILERHLECAASERRLRSNEEWLGHPEVREAVERLAARKRLVASSGGKEWAAVKKRPHMGVDLRGCGQSYAIEDQNGTLIGAIDSFRAWKECHPEAVYIHRGKTYLVESIDSGRMKIVAKRAKVNWHTRIRSRKETEILELLEIKNLGRCALLRCRLKITETISAYEKRSDNGQKLISVIPLDAPDYVFETEGICFVFPDRIRKKLEDDRLHFMGSIHALEHAAIGLLPLEIMADRNDFGGISIPLHPQLGLPAVFIYDAMPGGAGLTHGAFKEGRRILESVYKAVSACPCEDGCPGCVQSPKCGAGNRPLSKAGVISLLREVLSHGIEEGEICDSLESVSIPPRTGQESEASAAAPPPEAISLEPAPHAALETPRYASLDSRLRYVVFDVETRKSAAEAGGWNKADKMGVSVAVLYDSGEDTYFSYGQDELDGMFARMSECDLVIGFNNLRFDNQVLKPFWNEWKDREASRPDIWDLKTLDLFKVIRMKHGVSVSLDNLAVNTLGASKSSCGLQALEWWKEGRLDKIGEYCKKDVELTRNLYLYGLERGYVLYKNKAGGIVKAEVDFAPK